MTEHTPPVSLLTRVSREPTVHFALLAALLFAVTAFVGHGDDNVIEIDRDQIVLRIRQLEAERGAPLSVAERSLVEEAYIDERVLVREAKALGLEVDARVDDILAQKMMHVLSAEVIQPTQAELEAYYTENRMWYIPQLSVTIDEVVVPEGSSQGRALPTQLQEGVPPEELVGDLLIGHRVMSDMTSETLVQVFNDETAAIVLEAELGVWVGPHETVRGYHWLRVTERSESTPLPLDVVKDVVRLDWISEREQGRLDERIAELRRGYSIEFTREGVTP